MVYRLVGSNELCEFPEFMFASKYAEERPYLQQLYILKYLGVTEHQVSLAYSPKVQGKVTCTIFQHFCKS